jgi:large repetitive protein
MNNRGLTAMRKWLGLMLTLAMLLAAVPTAVAAKPAGAFGVVLDQVGRPVAGADIEFYQLGAGLVTVITSGPDGSFHMEQPVPDFSLWQLRVWAKGYRTEETGWINLGRKRYQSITLDGLTGGLRVAVRDDQGLPAKGTATLVGPAGHLEGHFPLDRGELVQPDLVPGEYQMLVALPGYLPVTESVTVVADKVTATVIALQKSNITVTGSVIDSTNNTPVPGATVELLRQDRSRVLGGTSDASGRFRVAAAGEGAGTYQLRVTAPGFRSALTQPITVTGGQEYDLSGAATIALTPLTGDLNGELRDRWGRPITNADVILLLQDYGEIASAKTNGVGQFKFADLVAGPGNQYAVMPVGISDRIVPIWTELLPGTANQMILQGQPGDTALFAEGSLSGVVTDPEGSPVAGAKVELVRNSWVTISGTTSATGAFLFNDVPANMDQGRETDPYTIRISKDGFVPTRQVTVAGQPQARITVGHLSNTAVRAVLHPITARLLGRVIDTQGEAGAGIQVALVSDDGAQKLQAATDANGWYAFDGVQLQPASRYYLEAAGAGFVPQTGIDVTDAVDGGHSLPTVTLSADKVTFMGQVIGQVGQPVANATVLLQGPGGEIRATATTDVTGFYRIVTQLPRTDLLTLTASLEGWSEALAVIADVPAAGATVSRSLVIFPASAALEGRVLEADGTPVSSAWVDLLEEGKGTIRSIQTDTNGRFRFDQVDISSFAWFSLRVRPPQGLFAGSLTHETELVPMLRLAPGQRTVTDLLVASNKP